MTTMNRFVIASDLDGTFFGTAATLIPRNLEAIQRFCQNGGIFCLSTGRDSAVLDRVFPQAAEYVNGFSILANGSYLYHFPTKEIRSEQSLNQEKTFQLINKLSERFPDVGYRISYKDGYLTNNFSEFMKKSCTAFLDLFTVGNIDHYFHLPWYKVVFCAEEGKILEVSKYLTAQNLTEFDCYQSTTTLYEIVPKGINKGEKINVLRQMYPNRKVICVGDFDNDLQMLMAADLSACPANANDRVKSIAKINLCHHNNGCIADLIEKIEKEEIK